MIQCIKIIENWKLGQNVSRVLREGPIQDDQLRDCP